MIESDVWIDKRERKVLAALVIERVFFSESLSLVLLRIPEKKTLRVSSIGWKTMRAMSEPMGLIVNLCILELQKKPVE